MLTPCRRGQLFQYAPATIILFMPSDFHTTVGMGLGYIVLTSCYYTNVFNGQDLVWMSTSLFDSTGASYNQSAVLTNNELDQAKLLEYGLPRYTTTYAVAQICYNLALGASVTHVLLWFWGDLKRGERH